MVESASVEPVTDESQLIAFPPMHTTSLSQLSAFLGCKTPVDVIAIVLSMNEPKERKGTPLQEIVIIDQTLTPKTLTMWGHFLTHQALDIADHLHTYPVIVCRSAVTDFADGSLSTTPFCYMTINPDIPETNDMRVWFNENKTMIMEFATPGKLSRKQAGHRLLEDGTSDTLTLTADDTNCVRIEGKMSVVDIHQDINNCECETCHKSIMKDAYEEFNCRRCNTKKKALPKCKVEVKINGDAGNLIATLYDENAESLLGVTATDSHEMQPQDINKMLEINQKLRTKVITAIVKRSSKVYADQKSRYTIQHWAERDTAVDMQSIQLKSVLPDSFHTLQKKAKQKDYALKKQRWLENKISKQLKVHLLLLIPIYSEKLSKNKERRSNSLQHTSRKGLQSL